MTTAPTAHDHSSLFLQLHHACSQVTNALPESAKEGLEEDEHKKYQFIAGMDRYVLATLIDEDVPAALPAIEKLAEHMSDSLFIMNNGRGLLEHQEEAFTELMVQRYDMSKRQAQACRDLCRVVRSIWITPVK